MEQEGQETLELREPSWAESHPWLAAAGNGEEDTVEEVIRYTLDELRLA